MHNKKLANIVNTMTAHNLNTLSKYLAPDQLDFLSNNPILNLGFIKKNYLLALEVKSDYGLFPSHETNPDKFSYSIINPSSIGGIFRSVFGKPQVVYVPVGAVMLNPNLQTMEYTINGLDSGFTFNSNSEREINQLNRVCIKNPHYFIFAYIVPLFESNDYNTQEKYTQIFYRNWLGKKYQHTPCMGYSKFPITDLNPISDKYGQVDYSDKYSMLMDWDYVPVENNQVMPKRQNFRKAISFKVNIKNGAYVLGDDMMAYCDLIQKEMLHHQTYVNMVTEIN